MVGIWHQLQTEPQALLHHQVRHYGIVRMVRDVFHISGFLDIDVLGHVIHIVLNQDALLARSLANSLQELLAPLHVVIRLGQT
ncbi:MAG: hypothetical protein NVS4B11_31080 [Ktedonobacteraceae bacterium]